MAESALSPEVDRLVTQLADAVTASGATVAVAESLTSGQICAALAAATQAGEWFRGGVVAYHPEVKYTLLGTPRGPVVTAATAEAMARAAAELLGASYAVSVTGVGGPDPQEGEPAGTVYIATCAGQDHVDSARYEFSGDPVAIMEQTIRAALTALLTLITRGVAP